MRSSTPLSERRYSSQSLSNLENISDSSLITSFEGRTLPFSALNFDAHSNFKQENNLSPSPRQISSNSATLIAGVFSAMPPMTCICMVLTCMGFLWILGSLLTLAFSLVLLLVLLILGIAATVLNAILTSSTCRHINFLKVPADLFCFL